MRVEHCIGILKERFPSLKELRLRIHSSQSNKLACDWFIVCCILHNIILTIKDGMGLGITDGIEYDFGVDEDDNEFNGQDNNPELEINTENQDARAELKRRALFTLIAHT